jgi:hypothetical protein
MIILGKIESTVLILNNTDGDQITANGYPMKTTKILTANCYEYGSKMGGLGEVPMNVYQGHPRLRKDFEQILSEFNSERSRLEGKKKEIFAKIANYEQTLNYLAEDLRKQLAVKREAEKMIASHKAKIESLREKLAERNISQLPTLLSLLEVFFCY